MSVRGQEVNWEDVETIIKKLSQKIINLPQNFDSISTISRGGLVPSRLLADSLGIKKIKVDSKKISSDSLFVDDIYDSGNTFEKIISKVDNPSNFVYVTLLARKCEKLPKQLIYGKKTVGKQYVVFPWDKIEFQQSQK